LKDHSLSAGRFVLNRVAVAAAVSALSALPMPAWALGLGKLNVQSALGEALRAEIDVSSLSPEEGATLQAKVATPETYRAAGVDFNGVLSATQITLQRRADGRPYLRIASDRAVQEPFVDVILDLSWSSGRLVREYTLLFDPPSVRQASQAAPMPTAPLADGTSDTAVKAGDKPAARSPALTEAPAPAKARSPKLAKAPSPGASAAESADSPGPAPAPVPVPAPLASTSPAEGDARSVRVKSGESLSLIAQRNAMSGVSLDQMLVGLYRNNPQAFQGDNMNRLKAGAVLNLPSVNEAQAVSAPEARQLIVAQSADFAAYRQRLAGTVVPSANEQHERQATGKVEAEVQDRNQAAAPTPDKLTLSKGGLSAGPASAVEDRVAKARAKEDSSARVAELSKNLDDLRKLKEKSTAASAPAKAAEVAPAPAPAPAPVVAPAPVPVPQVPSAPASAAVAEAMASAASTPSDPSATAGADPASMPASEPSRPAVSVPAPVAPPPAPQADDPGFAESLNPMLLAAGGAGVALLAGVAIFVRSRRRADTGETSFLESRLQPDSFFGASGGQRVDTRDATGGPSSMSYSLSQLDAIGDVDPVAEADVYLAYGRDLQAEEILKEALRSTPERLAIRSKLLEVYAKRRDTKGYEQLAAQLYGLTQGQGEDWLKAQELGLSIDPENPLYQPGGQPASAPSGVEAPSDMLGASTIPYSVMTEPSALDSIAPPLADLSQAGSPPSGAVDLDLDVSVAPSLGGVTDSVSPSTTEAGDLPPLRMPDSGQDFPVAQATAPAAFLSSATEAMALPSLESLDEGLDVLPSAPSAAPASSNAGLDFDLDSILPEPSSASAAAPSFDFNDISLELDAGSEPALAPLDSEQGLADLSSDPMARKLELADEFRQIGDADGARELLQEVIDNASDAGLRGKAQAMLDGLT
jgi:pilus assembly protein FimV